MKATIIVPVYNVEKYLSRCLDSLVHQTISDYEVLCVNDCSPDNSDLILAEYQEKYPSRIRVINNECNLGLGRTREEPSSMFAVNMSSLDSDDYVAPNYIETYLQAADDGDYDIIAGGS
ncbi:MAG: glycosyltransferase family 2 protein [Collinsella sp.]